MITIQIDCQGLWILFLKTLIKYVSMQPDWPLGSLIIYWKLGQIIGNLISIPVGLNSWMLLKKIYNQQVLKRICHLEILIGVLYMQLIVCAAIVLLLCLFLCVFVDLLQLKHFFFVLFFVCICLFITTSISSYLSTRLSHSVQLAFAIFEWLCSFFHNYFLLITLHLWIKSRIKIVVVPT